MGVLVVVGSILAGSVGPAEASPSKPLITNYSANPSALPYTGGTVTVSATVIGASRCTFSSNARGLTGLPTTVACDSGSASAIVVVATNTATATKHVTVTLTAIGTVSQASAKTQITIGPAPPPPTIANLGPTPDPVPYTGGTMTLSATVTNGSQCTFSSPSAAVSGLPETVACGTGLVSVTAGVSANVTTKTKKFKFVLLAMGPVKSAVAHGVITLAPAPPPVITSYKASPSPVSWTGGPATLTATVTNATTCTFSATGKAARVVSGLPVTKPCSSGSASVGITVGANHKRRLATYTVKVTATGSGTKVTTTTTITVSPVTTPPTISNFTTNPSPVASTGGPVTLSATVANAVSCTFSSKNSSVSGLPVTVPCSVGTVSATVTVPAATSHRAHSYQVQLTVHGQRKKVSSTALITVAGQGH